jgi:hypothetical protein
LIDEKIIVADLKGELGNQEIADKHGISVSRVFTLRKKYGIYKTKGKDTTERAKTGEEKNPPIVETVKEEKSPKASETTKPKKEEPVKAKIEEWVETDPEKIQDDVNEEIIREAEETKKMGRKPLNPDDFRQEKRERRTDYTEDPAMTKPVPCCMNCGTRRGRNLTFRIFGQLAICSQCDVK